MRESRRAQQHHCYHPFCCRLTKELAWTEEMVAAGSGLREGPPSTLFDRVFENEINIACFRARDAYDRMLFREALKSAAYDLGNARDLYRCVGARVCEGRCCVRFRHHCCLSPCADVPLLECKCVVAD